MNIEESDFKIIQHNDYSRYDLELLYVVNAKDPAKRREEFKEAGYSMTLESCLHKVINYRLSKKQDTYSLKGFLESYKEEMNSLKKYLNEKTGSIS